MMSCRDFEERVSYFIDGEIKGEELQEWIRHRDECPRCRALFEKLARIDSLVRDIPDISPEPMNPFDLMKEGQKTTVARLQAKLFPLAAVCALFIICLALFWHGQQPSAPHFPGQGVPAAAVADNPDIRYDVDLNESHYSLSIYGKEVSLVSFEISENGNSGVHMSFESDK